MLQTSDIPINHVDDDVNYQIVTQKQKYYSETETTVAKSLPSSPWHWTYQASEMVWVLDFVSYQLCSQKSVSLFIRQEFLAM